MRLTPLISLLLLTGCTPEAIEVPADPYPMRPAKIVVLQDCPGDVTGDAVVSVEDYMRLNGRIGTSCQDCILDLSGDGLIDSLDWAVITAHYGDTCTNAPLAFLSYFPDVDGWHIEGNSQGAYWPALLYSTAYTYYLPRHLIDSTRWYIDDTLVSTDRDTLRTYYPEATSWSQFVWHPTHVEHRMSVRCVQYHEGTAYVGEKCVGLRYTSTSTSSTQLVNITEGIIATCSQSEWLHYTSP